ncbi:ABC transporter permease subunit [Cloacibacillus evryensis]|uniref:ABC transporter permease subunit n=1 Tax=Cloacibacillus evryensis TaxID=508460 RepID=UPI003AB5F63C
MNGGGKIEGSFSAIIKNIGFARLVLGIFFIFLMILGFYLNIGMGKIAGDILKRVGMNGILVLAMVPSIQSGTGPNFALPVGIVCGLLGITCAIDFRLTGLTCILAACAMAAVFASVAGFFYGKLLNAVKGAEMMIATYTGFSIVAVSCLAWLMIPFSNPSMAWFMGKGLRETVQLDVVNAGQVFDRFLQFQIGETVVPTGLLLVVGLFCFGVYLFFLSKTGLAISAGGMNPKFSHASGLNIDRNRIIANVLSTILGAIGIIVYSQSFGFVQLYTAPLMMAFPAVAAVLIGGATASRAKVSHVVIGVVLFQGLLTISLPVTNKIFAGTDISEIMRAAIQNGIILYALTQVKGVIKK